MKLACKDLDPSSTCDFQVESETANDAAKQMLVHAREEHAADIADKTDEAAIAMMEQKAHE